MFVLFILSIVFISAHANNQFYNTDQPSNVACEAALKVGPTLNMSVPYYFPAQWNENMTGATYAANQRCKWTISIPTQTFALFTMMADIGGDSTLVVTDCNGKSETIMTSEQQPYIFVGVQFTIDLSVGAIANGTKLGFKVQWNNLPTPNPAFYNVSKTSEALVFDEMLSENSVVLTAETRVSLVAFPSVYPDLTSLLRLTLVFDGPTIESPYLGTLFQAVRANKPIVSRATQMTVFTFQEYYVVGSFFIVQDNFNVAGLAETKGITCWSQSSCPVTLNAANGPVSAMTLNVDDGNEYLKKLDLSPEATLKVFIGARREGDDSNVIVTYDPAQSKTNIPQKFNGELMTYYLENGTALIELAEDQNYTRWNDAVGGREGFITSKYYGYEQTYQDVYEVIGGREDTDDFVFRVNVTHVDVSHNSTLSIMFAGEMGLTEFRFASDGQSDNSAFSFQATNMTVSYFTNGTETKGFYLDFQIEDAISSAGNKSLFVVALLLSLFCY
ncbi:unnamed protein product [Caenorhabditis sp. 36 PRJEB53466]|nr:unnamed protein product [Caenorhabditis sp. 36 PRJEB53466]